MTKLFVGVDVGSASVRAGIFTMDGTRLAFSVRPIQQFHYPPNRVEQSSSDIWQQVCTTVREAIGLAGVQPQQVASIGFDATCSLVAVGDRGQPVAVGEEGDADHDIVMWMDHRAGVETQCINETNDSALQYVGGQVSIEMELPKILWLKQHYPERYASTWRFFDLADYLVWRATGVDAAGVCTLTCKWNYLAHEERFSQSLLESIELTDLVNKIPPQIIQIGQPVGALCSDSAVQLGLTSNVIVASGLIDAHAGGLALVATAPEANLALISGTSNCHMIVSQEAKSVPGVWGPYFAAMYPGWWLNEGGQSAAGALVDWTLMQSDAWPGLKNEAAALGCSVYQILNHWVAELEKTEQYPTRQLHILADHHGNRSPRSDASAKGMVAGITLEKGQQALARLYLATLQAIAYGTRHIIETMEQHGQRIDTITLCGGASKNPLWLREYANATGRSIYLVEEEDAVTLGAALNGAVACKVFDSFSSAARAMVRLDKTIKPDHAHRAFHDAKYQVYLQMYQDQQRYQAVMQQYLGAN